MANCHVIESYCNGILTVALYMYKLQILAHLQCFIYISMIVMVFIYVSVDNSMHANVCLFCNHLNFFPNLVYCK